jgi:hypothetical protein
MVNAGKISTLKIFISSSQKEFEILRRELKTWIDSEEFKISRTIPMEAILIERERGAVISEDIERALQDSHVYVGIFGRILSEWTVAEYREARRMGLPLLVYYVKKRKPGRPSRIERRGRKSKVERFLEDEAKKFRIRIRVYSKKEDIYSAVMNDLTYQIVKLVKEAIDVRKVLHKELEPL